MAETASTALVRFSPQDLDVIRSTIAPGANDAELALFVEYCKRTGLDPFSRQIYALRVGGKMSIQTSIDGFRVIGERSGDYAGQDGPYWCGSDGRWVDVWLSNDAPSAAKVGILRRSFNAPLYAVAHWGEYAQGSSPIWKKMPALMLAKVAEALALRKAFPNDLSGLYTSEEMAGAGAVVEPAPEPQPEPERPKLRVVQGAETAAMTEAQSARILDITASHVFTPEEKTQYGTWARKPHSAINADAVIDRLTAMRDERLAAESAEPDAEWQEVAGEHGNLFN